MRISRRKFLTRSTAAAGLLAASSRFSVSHADDKFLEITAGPNNQVLYPDGGKPSSLWSYNNTTPGPEIRVRRGERVRVRLVNNLAEPTSIHWHGVRIQNAMDGVAGLTQEAVPPGGSFEYNFIVPDAGTFWYHAHTKSWRQVARGLYGALIIDEEKPAFDRDHDLTLTIDDWRLDQDGTLDVASIGSLMDWSHGGRLGNWLTVNGKSIPEFTLNAGEAYRLRLINVSNSRVFQLDPRKFDAKVLAYDGQAFEAPSALVYGPMLLGPAQRVDLLVAPKSGGNFELEEVSRKQPFEFAKFSVKGNGEANNLTPVVSRNAIPEPDVLAARQVNLEMSGGAMGDMREIVYNGKVLTNEDFRMTKQLWAFNGVANLANEPLFRVKSGESVVLRTSNNTAFAHAMHVHGHHFRVIERSASSVDEGKPWRDTFMIGPEQITKIAFVADNPGKWLLHCHMLEHAAAGMTTWFEVTPS
jgi:FtsP/CotA-like multicopper oxidase with cupredoxin domain